MSEKEYIVTLNKDVDYEAFNNEMIASTGAGAIPSRSAPIANPRPASKRNTHYMLTDAEAETLRTDPRVLAVEIPPEKRDDIVIIKRATQTGDFSKTTLDRGFFINWGLARVNSSTNPYNEDSTPVTAYNYTMDGTGIDIVIQDSGLQADHPEFQDANGVSRVQQIDWYDESGLPGSMPTNHYTDFDGHGTHCAGISAGKRYGWAKNANIYAVKVAGLEGPSDPNNGIPITDCFDVIKEWHANKPVDSATGAKRPTIVNMSWGYSAYYSSVSDIFYRSTVYSGVDVDTPAERYNFGLVPIFDPNLGAYVTNVRVPSVDADIEEMIDEGIHVVIAAGNNYHKIESLGGVDYDNYAVTNAGTIFYHRGSSPYSPEAHIVGNIDSEVHSGGLEQKSESSEAGPGVSIFAPGTNIMSSVSQTNTYDPNSGPYPDDTDFKITNLSGTSMAAPQVAGVISFYLQLNPTATPEQVKAFIESTAKTEQIYETGLNNDYTDTRSLYGAEDRYLFNKFNSAVRLLLGAGS